MRATKTLAAASVTIALTTTLPADTRISVRYTQPGQEPQTQSLMVTSERVRMEERGRRETVMLYHREQNVFYALQPAEKSYIALDPQKAIEMMEQAARAQERMEAQLEERLAEMPEAQREHMREMMKRSGRAVRTPHTTPPQIRYESSGVSGDASGFSCRWVTAYEEERKVRELCLAEPGALGLSSDDRDTMLAMQQAMKAMVRRLGSIGMFQDDVPGGVPVHVRHFDANGRLTSEQQVEAVAQDSLDGSLFEIPDDYQERALPGLRP